MRIMGALSKLSSSESSLPGPWRGRHCYEGGPIKIARRRFTARGEAYGGRVIIRAMQYGDV